MNPLANLSELPIHTSRLCVVQCRFPKSKKPRIRKKWGKRPQNFKPDPRVMVFDGMLVCHPSIASELQHLTS